MVSPGFNSIASFQRPRCFTHRVPIAARLALAELGRTSFLLHVAVLKVSKFRSSKVVGEKSASGRWRRRLGDLYCMSQPHHWGWGRGGGRKVLQGSRNKGRTLAVTATTWVDFGFTENQGTILLLYSPDRMGRERR